MAPMYIKLLNLLSRLYRFFKTFLLFRFTSHGEQVVIIVVFAVTLLHDYEHGGSGQ